MLNFCDFVVHFTEQLDGIVVRRSAACFENVSEMGTLSHNRAADNADQSDVGETRAGREIFGKHISSVRQQRAAPDQDRAKPTVDADVFGFYVNVRRTRGLKSFGKDYSNTVRYR